MKVTFESKGNFEKLGAWLDSVSNNTPDAALIQIANEGDQKLSENTPRDTGKTAEGWESVITTKDGISEIAWTNKAHPDSKVNVAKLIDQGHGTGTGGFVPPMPYIQKSMDSVWKTAGDKVYKGLIK